MDSSGFDYYLNKLRARPEASRRRYAFAAALFLTLVVGAAELINLRHFPVTSDASLAKVAVPEISVVQPKTDTAKPPGPWERIALGWQKITAQATQLFQK